MEPVAVVRILFTVTLLLLLTVTRVLACHDKNDFQPFLRRPQRPRRHKFGLLLSVAADSAMAASVYSVMRGCRWYHVMLRIRDREARNGGGQLVGMVVVSVPMYGTILSYLLT